MRPSTNVLDIEILKLYYSDSMDPKLIRVRLHLTNVWRVYDALKRDRRARPRQDHQVEEKANGGEG